MGMRNHDHTAIPMCRWCHEAWHAGARAFKLFDKHEKRAYHASAIEKYRKLYALSKGPGM